MSYETLQNSASRTSIDKIVIEMATCARTFGIGLCTASGEPCYNTYSTCQVKGLYSNAQKDYSYTNNDITNELKRELFPARPYIKSLSENWTEIKDKDTVPRVLKVTFNDEPDNDIGTDPYYDQRTSIQGTYWKKWIARNPNYKGKLIKLYRAYSDGSEVSEFVRKFVGRIENITLGNGTVTFEATDLLKKLSEIQYPLESNYSLNAEVPNIHLCGSEDEMLKLNAEVGDYAERTDFKSVSIDNSNDQTGGMEETDFYIWQIVAYDLYDRPFAKTDVDGQYNYFATAQYINAGHAHYVSWNSVTYASYYKVFYKTQDATQWQCSDKIINREYLINSKTGYAQLNPPISAELFYKLQYVSSTTSNTWVEYHNDLAITLDVDSDFDDSGYVKLGDEIIYYSGKNTGVIEDTLTGVKRHQFNTEPSRHLQYSKLHYMFNEDPNNPFTLLKKILQRAGILDYAADKFTEYEASWSGINFSCNVIVKKTKLSEIYFDLVNVLDCISWTSEDGTIEILKRSERPSTYKTIKDSPNIILNSGNVDLNESSRKTAWYVYWNKYDVEASYDDENAYNYVNKLFDADAEHEYENAERLEDPQYTRWVNINSGTKEDIDNYFTWLLGNRKTRTRDGEKKYTCQLNTMDADLQIGNIVKLSTDDLQNADGTPYQDVLFRAVKKTPQEDKFTINIIEVK